MSREDSNAWLAARSYEQRVDAALSLDFCKAFGHAFPSVDDHKALDALSSLHKAASQDDKDCTVLYVAMFASLYQRLKDAKGEIRSRGSPLLFLVWPLDRPELDKPVVVLSMRDRLRYNASTLCEAKSACTDAEKLGAALHAGLTCEPARVRMLEALIKSCTDDTGKKQLHTARYCLQIGRLNEAAQHLVKHFVYYGEWGRAAGVCAWYQGCFVTAGLPDWMTAVAEDSLAIHNQKRIEFSTAEQITIAITDSKTEGGPFVPVETFAVSPVRNTLFVPVKS